MARYKIVDRSPRLLPIVLDAQLVTGSFEYALDYLIDHEIDLSELDRRYRNDDTGAPAYDPAVMLKIVLLAYSRGVVSSRAIERLCRENVLFMAISGDSAPQFTTIAKFVRELAQEVSAIFTQVLLTCDRQGLIGRQMFAIDGVKLSSNADKRRSGTHGELAHEAGRMEAAVTKMLKAHRNRDESKVSRSIRNSPFRTIEISPPLDDGGGRWRRHLKLKWPVSPPCRAAISAHRLVSPCPGWAWRSRWLAKNVGKKFGA